MEKTLELRVRAIIGPEMAKLQQELRAAGLLGTQAGRMGATAGRDIEQGFQRGNRAAKDFNGTIQNSAKYLQLVKGVISAFLLYRGFSFLTQQAGQFTRTLVDVQHQVGIIQTQLNDTGKDFRGQITRNIMRTASETGMAMESLARTEYEIVSANIQVADSYRILDLSARAAVAGGMREAEVAFDAALSQVNTFEITFERAFDLQFQTLKRGIFNYEQYTTVIGTLSEAFDSMGQSAETANASAAAISQVFTGKQFERGATGLRNAVVRISEAPEDFRNLGVEVTKANGDFRNFIEIAEDLNTVLKGLSTSERAQVIKNLFPDERERRGIGAFLGQLDKAEQFFIEQQFAADALNEAYETANDSLLTQAHIFEQNLTPAMEPFVDLMGGLLGIFNNMDETLPGLNKSLLTTATVAAIIGSGTLMTGNRFPLSTPYFGRGPLGASRAPTGLGMAAASIIPLTSFMSAQSHGASAGSYLGGALGGAFAGGTVGGLPGAAVGAAVGLIATALGDAMHDDADDVAKSFSEAFATQLEQHAGGIADAFARALNMEIAGEGAAAGGITLKKQGSTSGVYGSKEQREQLREILRSGGTVSLDREPVLKGKNFTVNGRGDLTFTGPGDIEALNREIAKKGVYVGGQGSLTATTTVSEEARRNTIRSNMESFQEFRRNALRVAPVQAASAGVTEKQFLTGVTQQATSDLTSDLTALGRTTASAMGLFAQALSEGRVKMDQLDEGLDILGEGTLEQQKAFLRFIGVLEEAGTTVKESFETVKVHFESLFSGDANLAADVFSRMGTEGEKLAKVFQNIGRTMQAFSTLQTLSSMTMANPAAAGHDAERAALEKILATTSMHPIAVAGRGRAQKKLDALDAIPETTNLLESLGIDSITAGKMLTDRLMADLGMLKDQNGKYDTAKFVEALLSDGAIVEKVAEPLELSSNSLADALFEAADQVRFGLMESMKFTADQLEMYGEEFKELNRLVRQKAILEEIKGIAEFAGVGDKGIQGAMDILRTEMVNSGKALFDVLSDPASLAELIAKMEFGDVTVDNSINAPIVVRIEAGAGSDTQAFAAAADVIVSRLNELSRQKAR